VEEKIKELEEKREKDYAQYRLGRVLEILLQADLMRLEELFEEERKAKSTSNKNSCSKMYNNVEWCR
jgi:hypothetical protein